MNKTGTILHTAVTHEEPVYKEVKVVDKKAWDETVVLARNAPDAARQSNIFS